MLTGGSCSPCPELDPRASLVIPTRVWVDEYFQDMYPNRAAAAADVDFVLGQVQAKFDLLQRDAVRRCSDLSLIDVDWKNTGEHSISMEHLLGGGSAKGGDIRKSTQPANFGRRWCR